VNFTARFGFCDGEDRVAYFFGPDGGYFADVFAGFFGEGRPEVFCSSVSIGVFGEVAADTRHEDVFA